MTRPRNQLNPYYVYALRDPRLPNASPFYIGKGTGTRFLNHAVRPDNTRKGDRIREIQKQGHDVLPVKLVSDLTEHEAVRIEAELISAFGTVDTGGLLLNEVLPTGKLSRNRKNIVIPTGTVEKAQLGLSLIKAAVFELASANRTGITNADAAKGLGLQSEHNGKQQDYLTYSILGILMREGKIRTKTKTGSTQRRYHKR